MGWGRIAGFDRVRWAAIGAAVAVSLGAGGLSVVNATLGSGDKPVFVAIAPCRLADTRPAPTTVGGRSTPIGSAEVATFQVHGSNGSCTIPAGAVAIATNVTILDPTSDSYLSVFPADVGPPNASNLNWKVGQAPTPNQVTVDLSATGAINVFNERGMVNLIIDIVGYFEDHTHDDRYYTEPEVDARLVGERQQTATSGGAAANFVFPASQLTLGSGTITTSKAGHLELHFVGSGGLRCTDASSYSGWLTVDGQPVRSSRVSIGENLDVLPAESFSAANFSQKVLHGVTSTPIPAGSHQVRALFACITGMGQFSNSNSFSLTATVLSGIPDVAADEYIEILSNDNTMCVQRDDGTEECIDG